MEEYLNQLSQKLNSTELFEVVCLATNKKDPIEIATILLQCDKYRLPFVKLVDKYISNHFTTQYLNKEQRNKRDTMVRILFYSYYTPLNKMLQKRIKEYIEHFPNITYIPPVEYTNKELIHKI
jgi:hypothetical protein